MEFSIFSHKKDDYSDKCELVPEFGTFGTSREALDVAFDAEQKSKTLEYWTKCTKPLHSV